MSPRVSVCETGSLRKGLQGAAVVTILDRGAAWLKTGPPAASIALWKYVIIFNSR